MNIQPVEKRVKKSQTDIELINVFSTIQGEGPYAGYKAVFVRLAGCNLQCPGCDTDYTTGRFNSGVKVVLNLINQIAIDTHCSLIVITGGEPFRQDISELCNTLVEYGYTVQIESNGTLAPSPGLSDRVCIVCSPKTGTINNKMLGRANCFKYVLDADNVHIDGLPTTVLDHSNNGLAGRPALDDKRPIYLQPMDAKDPIINKKNQDAVRDSCLEHGHILQLQIHKIVGIE